MAALGYVGRGPGANDIVVPKKYADAQGNAAVVTPDYVNAQVAQVAPYLTTKSYVDQQNALYAQQSAVTAADNTYVANSALNAPNGVAGLDPSGDLPAARIPNGVRVDRVIDSYSVGFQAAAAGVLGGTLSTMTHAIGVPLLTGSRFVSSQVVRELALAMVVIPDPGYPWIPLPFGWVAGNAAGGDKPSVRTAGNSNYGQLTVMPPHSVSDQVYGMGICTASYYTGYYPIMPAAFETQTPTTVPPINGGLELDLYGCCFAGQNYQFFAANMSFWVLVVPALP